jgi:Transposase DDE domain
MSKNLFKQVQKALISLQPKDIQGHALKRVITLTAFVSGMIRSQSCHLNALGSGLPQDINDASREAAAKRFVENKHTTYSEHYLPYLKPLLASIIAKTDPKQGIVLVIDGSQMGSGHVTLMVSIFYNNRSIPIFWLVKEGKKGHFPTQMHVDIIKKVAAILKPIVPKDMPITLLGDGEFDSVDLQQLCRHELFWHYVFRTACDTPFYENDDLFKPQSIILDKKETFVFIPSVDFSNKKYPDVHFLYWHDRNIYDDPLYLVSSYDDPFDIIYFYKKRFSIETLFKDLKSRGFNLHKNRLTKAFAVFNLILIAALGFCLLIAFGQKNKDNPLKNKVLRIHKVNKNELSVFSYGFKLLKYLLRYNRYFSLQFALL